MSEPTPHTPGPWKVAGPSQNGHCRRIFAGDEYVGIVGGSNQPMRTIRANADLIAAAPDLLAACRMALNEVEFYSHGTVNFLALAIEKATGVRPDEIVGEEPQRKPSTCSLSMMGATSSGACEVCDQYSKTRYLLQVGELASRICPFCKGNLRSDIEEIDRRYEGV